MSLILYHLGKILCTLEDTLFATKWYVYISIFSLVYFI